MRKRILCLLLTLLLVTACVSPAFASQDTTVTFVLVHGMMGWGENDESDHQMPYWGFTEENDITAYLRSKGYEVAVPTLGPLSSAWDRACELFAQITGTVVDYGAAHAAKMGHERYGRDYTGRGLLREDWDCERKINLITHSFGGPTASVFAYLMAYGAQEEIAAAPDDCSELFKGGHDSVFSVTTLESPHNGSPIANLLYDTKVPVYAVALLMNLVGMSKKPALDCMLDQWGITADPSTGERARLNLTQVKRLAASDDHCAYDMSLQGAKDLERYTAADCTYYYSYAAAMTKVNENGRVTVADDYKFMVLAPSAKLITMMAGHTLGGVYIDSSWAENDGLVPVPSALYPRNAENNHKDYVPGEDNEKGVWYVMPVYRGTGATHGYGVAGKTAFALYDEIVGRINDKI